MRLPRSRNERRLDTGWGGSERPHTPTKPSFGASLAFLRLPGRFVSLGLALVAMGVTAGLAGANGGPLGLNARAVACASPLAVDVGCDRSRAAGKDAASTPNFESREGSYAGAPVDPASGLPGPAGLTVSEEEPATVGTGGDSDATSGGDQDDHPGGDNGDQNGDDGDDDDRGHGGGDDDDHGEDPDTDPGGNATPGLYASGGGPLFSLSNLAAGKRVERCISVMYVGSRPARVQLYASRSGTGLEGFLDVVVERGTMPAATDGGCRGFRPDGVDYVDEGEGVLFRGRLASFPADTTETNPADEPWQSGENHSYRITTTVASVRAAQGLSVNFDFIWRART